MVCKQRLLPGLVALFARWIDLISFPLLYLYYGVPLLAFSLTPPALLLGFSLTPGHGHTQDFLPSPGSTSPPPGFSAGMSIGPLPLSAQKQWNLEQSFLRLAFYPPGYCLAPCRLDFSCMAVSRPVFFVDCNPRSHINPDPLGDAVNSKYHDYQDGYGPVFLSCALPLCLHHPFCGFLWIFIPLASSSLSFFLFSSYNCFCFSAANYTQRPLLFLSIV